jgi:hypothetical protein
MRGGCSLIEEFLLKGKLLPNDKPYDADPTDTGFGYSLAWCPDGDLLAVGAPDHDSCDPPEEDDTGAVYLYEDKKTVI